MLPNPVIAAINHLLEREDWARERLTPFAGRTVEFRLPPLPDLRLAVLDGGLVGGADSALPPDLVVRIPPASVPGILARDEAALREVAIEGDTELARAVQFLFRHLRWDAEEDLARVVGDVPAHRVAEAGRAFAAWNREAAERLGRNFAEYFTEEAGLLARPAEVSRFGAEVDALRDDVERLEKRIARLLVRGR
ncbi:MAG: SCP2 sterol-binding domain-containing protein [Burkholderiales bacterium]|nr:SCP2 sterol-binding domain-containing protein [Burkholderiales bacterium]